MMGTYPEDKEVNFKGFHYKIWNSLSSKIKFQITVTNKKKPKQEQNHEYISVAMSKKMPTLTG